MPLPMVHLSIAYDTIAHGGISFETDAARGAFLLGSVAPDSIHMREGWTPDDKRRVHVFDEQKSLSIRFGAIEGLRAEAKESRLRKAAAEMGVPPEEKRAFLAGYCTHIAADALWSHLLVRSYYEAKSARCSFEEYRKLYYRETDKADFHIFHTAPWREDAWRLLRSARAINFLDYLSAEEIGKWRDRTIVFFDDPDKEPANEPEFFTSERTERFIRVATDACVAGLRGSFATVGHSLEEEFAVGALADDLDG